jgi:hypothetical protein
MSITLSKTPVPVGPHTKIHIYVRTKSVPETFDYILLPLGRKPDEECEILHRVETTFEWENVTPVEMDRFTMLAKLHGVRFEFGHERNQYPDAVTAVMGKEHYATFFEIVKKEEG